MTQILRYDTTVAVTTPLNPLEDLTSWIKGLRSIGYTSDILRAKHKITNKADIQKGSQLISLFSSNAVGLLDQAYAGPEEMSFLPLYYAILNLSKIYIITSGHMNLLAKNRHHGGSYNPNQKASRDLLTEEVILRHNGILPLFYQSITNENWTFKTKKLSLGIYTLIFMEYLMSFLHAYKSPFSLQQISVDMSCKYQAEEYRLQITVDNKSNHKNAGKRRFLKILNGKFAYEKNNHKYVSELKFNNFDEASQALLLRNIRRYLIYTTGGDFNF